MSGSEPIGTEIADYAEIFGADSPQGKPVVVGGQAANAWALVYSARLGRKLSRYRPFTSKDLDLAGDRALLEHIRRITSGTIRYSEPRTPVVGSVEVTSGKLTRKIEVLRDVKGLKRTELSDSIEITVGDIPVRVLAPIKVLKAKICNVVTLDQEDRNDVNHVRIMIECVREFIRDVFVEAVEGRVTQRNLVNLLEELREVILSSVARKAREMWNFDFGRVWPLDDLLNSDLQKVQRFVEHRLSDQI